MVIFLGSCLREWEGLGVRGGRTLFIFRVVAESDSIQVSFRWRSIFPNDRDISLVQNAELSASAIGDEIKENFHLDVSKSKINQIRHRLHCNYQPPPHMQKLPDDHVYNRTEFCKKRKVPFLLNL
jgi:hypothetical protein